MRAGAGKIDLEIIGRLADKADNFVHSTALPVDPAIHVEGLTGGMKEIRDELRKFYCDATGTDPWKGTT